MTKFGLLGAAAMVLSSALVSPALARDMTHSRSCVNGTCERQSFNSDDRRAVARHADRGRIARGDAGWTDDRGQSSGFWPGDVAAGAVGGAIGTAGAIATAPFRASTYAWDDGHQRGWDNRSYAERNGFVCTPGTWYRGEDGRRHICQ